MKVGLSASAEADLRAIARWIAADNPAGARAFSRALRVKCATLARSPRRFPLVRQVSGHDLRKRTHRDYLIFYIIWERRIEVVRIVHGSRDWVAMPDEE